MAERLSLRSVGVPTEHGGWSLTLEPVVLGLLVTPSWSGAALGAAALLAFVARTPLKLAMVDRRRHRELPRTQLATQLVAIELLILAALVVFAFLAAEKSFLWPLAMAAPLVVVELWYDIRSRSRRLVPELAGSIGVASVAAAITLAGGGSDLLAAGLWCVAAARAIAAIAFVRLQLRRSKDQAHTLWLNDGFQLLAMAAVVVGWLFDAVSLIAVVAIALLSVIHFVLTRIKVPSVPVIGAQQVVLGLTVVLVVGLAELAP